MPQEKYKLQIMLISDTLIGAAEGFGAIIDKDSLFDKVGLPIIPGKRVKGVFREQADLLVKYKPSEINIDKLFGSAGMTDKVTEYLSVGNFVLDNYAENREYLKYLIQNKAIARSEVISYFTSLRTITRIEDGIASDNSLRTIRVLKKGLVFTGELAFDSTQINIFKEIFLLTRRIGSMRNRGLGHIQCTLIQDVTSNVDSVKYSKK
jgi:CRISPR-associated protein Csx10